MGLISETFDIRVEVQAPVNGSEAYNGGVPSSDFSVVIAGGDAEPIDITQFFQIEEPEGKPVALVSLWKIKLTHSPKVQLHLLRRLVRPKGRSQDPRQRPGQILQERSAPQTRAIHCYIHLQRWTDYRCQVGCPSSLRKAKSQECYRVYW